jgi:sensor histidine kinase YesM
MKMSKWYELLNQRKPLSHIVFLGFSLVVTFILQLSGNFEKELAKLIAGFLMLFIQLEIFIYFGNLIFSKVKFDRRPGEITRAVLLRLIIFLVICLFASMVLFILLLGSLKLLSHEELKGLFAQFLNTEFRPWFKSTLMGLSLGAIIFIILLWQESLRREQKLREQNLIFQNETLKNQVNPHFLFNSLNTISSLIQTQPEEAERFINDLSSIYRYIIENGQKDKVPLSLELEFVSDYYKLHRTRDEEKILLSIDVRDAGKYQILPVSLQTLLENAIKHNIATRQQQLRISIYLEGNYIIVSNNLQRKATQLRSTATGLKNLSERLRLISGREMIIEEDETTFTVKLPLLI